MRLCTGLLAACSSKSCGCSVQREIYLGSFAIRLSLLGYSLRVRDLVRIGKINGETRDKFNG